MKHKQQLGFLISSFLSLAAAVACNLPLAQPDLVPASAGDIAPVPADHTASIQVTAPGTHPEDAEDTPGGQMLPPVEGDAPVTATIPALPSETNAPPIPTVAYSPPPTMRPTDMPAPTVPADTPVSPPNTNTPPPSGPDYTVLDHSAEMAALINQAREAQGLAHVTINPLLINAAVEHSLDMALNAFFDHAGSDGSSAADRVSAQGYAWTAVGENIAAGSPSITETFDMWWNSPSHQANILNPKYKEIGLGHVYRATSEWGDYWTLVLARP